MPDRRAGVEHDAAGAGHLRRQPDGAGQVGRHSVRFELRQVRTQAGDALAQEIGRNVHADETFRLQQPAERARLLATARAQFDDGAALPHGPGDVVAVGVHHFVFGAGGVVLGQAGDLFEQLRAALVVEVFG